MAGATYEVRVTGAVPFAVLREIGGVTSTEQELRTVLVCTLPDQAALHGLLARLRTFGLDLVEVRAVPSADEDDDEADDGDR